MRARMFLESISLFISNNKLMDKGSLYLAALSGGADSVCLLLALKELGYNVEAVHCNFHLRGKESDRDEEFCKRLCQREGISIHIVHFDTAEYATLHKVSIEMAARELRYAYFEQLRNDLGAKGICIGHHREDSVETLLINLIRGTGINGLTGIAAKNGMIIRPLLDVSRRDIEDYLEEKGQEYVTDSTNLVDDVTRNKIRLNLMPLIRSINPSADKDIAKTARRVSEAAKVFEHAITQSAGNVTEAHGEYTKISIGKLRKETSPEYTLFYILSHYGFSSATIEDIHGRLHQLQTGKVFFSPTHKLLIDRDYIVVERTDQSDKKEMKIPETGTYVFDESTKFHISEKNIDSEFEIERNRNVATLDLAKVSFPLIVRHAKQGDWFIPFGMKGRKLVSDYLTDRKKSLFDKGRQLVMTDSTGNIIWVVGERSDNRYRIGDKTEKALLIGI